MNILEKITSKLISGKYFLTVCCGIVFVYVSVKGILPEEAIVAIIMYIVQAYFHKEKEEK